MLAIKTMRRTTLTELHRRELEQRALSANIATAETNVSMQKRGQVFGFAIGLVSLGVAFAAVLKGAQAAAIGVGGTTLASLVSVFIYGRRPRSKSGESAK